MAVAVGSCSFWSVGNRQRNISNLLKFKSAIIILDMPDNKSRLQWTAVVVATDCC